MNYGGVCRTAPATPGLLTRACINPTCHISQAGKSAAVLQEYQESLTFNEETQSFCLALRAIIMVSPAILLPPLTPLRPRGPVPLIQTTSSAVLVLADVIIQKLMNQTVKNSCIEKTAYLANQ